ncbi:MAG: CHAP domain-containing protein [Alphaproteobacteria bacterium]|nr:CHAP domain-containing protein [Alphaproteobacteria bacterium]
MRGKTTLFAVLAAALIAAAPLPSQAAKSSAKPQVQKTQTQKWQCVPFARLNSDITLRGDAWRWWQAAEGQYTRGQIPQEGSVMVFKQSGKMKRGHVAVVTNVIDERKVLIDHANWQRGRAKGQINTHVAVIDVSENNDWSQVRVWYDPIKDFGSKSYPIYGFIYSPTEDGMEFAMATDSALPMKGERLEADPALAISDDANSSGDLALGTSGSETP